MASPPFADFLPCDGERELYATSRGSRTRCNLAPPDGIHPETPRSWIVTFLLGNVLIRKREKACVNVRARSFPCTHLLSTVSPPLSLSSFLLRDDLSNLRFVQCAGKVTTLHISLLQTMRWWKLLIRRVACLFVHKSRGMDRVGQVESAAFEEWWVRVLQSSV